MVPSSPAWWAGFQRERYLDDKELVSFDYRSRLEPIDKDLVLDTARKLFESFDWTLGLLGDVPEETRSRIEAKLNQRKSQ